MDLGDDFLDMTPLVPTTKLKINKWDSIKPQCFCTAKETVNHAKGQPMEGEKIFANHIFDKGLISKICEDVYREEKTPTNNPMKK